MQISSRLPALQREAPTTPEPPSRMEEAARDFEEVFVRQFVSEMTKGLFKSSLAGDNGPSWMSAQQDLQRDTLTDTLTRHLTDSGHMGIADMLRRQWTQSLETPQES